MMSASKKLITTPLRLFSSSSVQLTRAKPTEGSQRKLTEAQNTALKRREYRFAYPEFLPDPEPKFRNATKEMLERQDMLKRRENTSLPEFYVGSIVAVTTSIYPEQQEANVKENRFVGIVIDRGGSGLSSWIVVRNVISGVGIEFMYDIYSPTVKDIEVLRLEKRLDDELYYLRDADPINSTVPTDMLAELLPEGLPLNDIVLPIKAATKNATRWEKFNQEPNRRLFGYEIIDRDKFTDARLRKEVANKAYLGMGWNMEYFKYDLIRDYFLSIPLEEQDRIWAEVGPELERREAQIKRLAARKALSVSAKK